MGKIILRRLTLSIVPTANQTVTVKVRPQASADVAQSYTQVFENVTVKPDGVLLTPLVISNLQNGADYLLRISNNCGNSITNLMLPVSTTGQPV